MYQQDQKRVYQEMSGKPGDEKVIQDAEKSETSVGIMIFITIVRLNG